MLWLFLMIYLLCADVMSWFAVGHGLFASGTPGKALSLGMAECLQCCDTFHFSSGCLSLSFTKWRRKT